MAQFTPEVGLGIAYNINGDSYPYTIRKVSKSKHQFWATRDEFRAKPGVDQAYTEGDKEGVFVPKPNAQPELFTRSKDGKYHPAGCKYVHVSAGRSFRQDPSF
jgi:hypothetical protein